MNEVAASFLYVYLSEAIYVKKHIAAAEATERGLEMASFLMDLEFIEADIFNLFSRMMEIGHLEMFRPSLSESQRKKQESNLNSKKQSAILIRISKIQDHYLKIADLELFKHFKMLNVELQIFLLRWIRCVHTREFTLQDSFLLWDNIFLEYSLNLTTEKEFFLIDCICLAMIVNLRKQCKGNCIVKKGLKNKIIVLNLVLEKEEQSDCLTLLLKYPHISSLTTIVNQAFKIKGMLPEITNMLFLNELVFKLFPLLCFRYY